jgi:hypothetical protein
MLCCNLIADGEINGNIFMLAGNVTLGLDVNFCGKVNLLSGNLLDQSGKFTGDEASSQGMLTQVIVLLCLVTFLALLAVGILLYMSLNWIHQKCKKPVLTQEN